MRNKKLSILAVLVMLVTITTYSVSGTYAKYTTSGGTTDSARVARWSIKVGETTEETIGLFSKTYGENNEVNAAAAVVAPGTSGSYSVSLTGDTEVAYTVDTKITIKNNVLYSDGKTSPIKLSIDGEDWYDYDDEDFTKLLTKSMNKAAGPASGSVAIYWKWAFSETELNAMEFTHPTTGLKSVDEEDTILGQSFMNAKEKIYKDEYKAKLVELVDDASLTTLEELEEAGAAFIPTAKKAGDDAVAKAIADGTIEEPTITITVSITATQINPNA